MILILLKHHMWRNCDPSDRNESHVGKLHFWENSKMWSTVIFLLISRY